MVSAIIGGKKTVGMLWIENNFVEVDDGIKMASGADPYVDRLSIRLAQRAGMVIVRSYVRGDGRAIDAQPVRMRSLNNLLVRGNDLLHPRVVLFRRHLCVARQTSKIVHTFEHDHPAHARWSEHIAIESRESIRTESISQQMIPANALVRRRQCFAYSVKPATFAREHRSSDRSHSWSRRVRR